jgi:hypothetical protein
LAIVYHRADITHSAVVAVALRHRVATTISNMLPVFADDRRQRPDWMRQKSVSPRTPSLPAQYVSGTLRSDDSSRASAKQPARGTVRS